MTAIPQSNAPNHAILTTPFARGMAFAAYFLLLAAIPTAGFGAVLGLIIAYARRDGASPLIRSHHRFQIRLFWIGLALAAAAAALGVGAWIAVWRAPLPYHHFQAPPSPDAQTVAYHPGLQETQFHTFHYSWHDGEVRAPARAAFEGYAALATLVAAGLWSIAAPLWGLVRLASDRPMGHSAR